ncbi:MAG: restriction endonuclease subunit [Mucilaginibacter sp.]|nr:restriction endonuclease subunit [Mucilaginibacter sp.]
MKDHRLVLYKSLFKGREDVFALRWEMVVSSQMPACSFDPHRYRQHQIIGGTYKRGNLYMVR